MRSTGTVTKETVATIDALYPTGIPDAPAASQRTDVFKALCVKGGKAKTGVEGKLDFLNGDVVASDAETKRRMWGQEVNVEGPMKLPADQAKAKYKQRNIAVDDVLREELLADVLKGW